jgi:hypothetical protein
VIAASLWATVIASGIFHGLNPAMGWPLAVSAGLMGEGRRDLLRALGLLALGHLAAMAALLLPFAALNGIVAWQGRIRTGAALTVIAFGLWLLVRRQRHPRMLRRIAPGRLALWSFAIATAHGAGLMLLPIYLGICRAQDLDRGHQAARQLIGGDLATALAVSLVHTAAMVTTGGLLALAVQAWLGLRFISKSWLNLDAVWAASLILVGGIALVAARAEAM